MTGGQRNASDEPGSNASADTLPALLARRAERTPRRVALREKEFGIWQEITWADYLDRVRRFSLGLAALGVRQGDRIAIVGDNRPEWTIAQLAAQTLGALPLGLYQDAVAAELAVLLEAASPRVVVAEDQEQVDKVLEVREGLPALEHVVHYDDRGLHGYEAPGLVPFEDMEALGAEAHARAPDAFARKLAAVQPDDIALLCTTSGTTSRPKLAMLSHANLVAMADQLQQADPMTPDDDFVSFLPLAWMGEQMISVFAALTVGFVVNFPEEAETVRKDLREIGPQAIMSPPRIWENMVSDVQVMAQDATPLKRRAYRWAMRAGRASADARFAGRTESWRARTRRRVADWLVLRPIRDQLGLDRVRRAYTGGAALGPDVFRFFHAIGVNLKQLYGQTEVSGISVVHRDGDVRFQTVGTPLPDTRIRISEEGEILCRSPAVFQGYFRNPDATRDALDDGWLRSGDAGYFDDGHLVVIDRLADVTRLPNGESFSPQFVENKLKFSPYVREAVVFGGGRGGPGGPNGRGGPDSPGGPNAAFPFATAMIAIDMENAGQWAERRRIAYTTFTDLARKPEVYALVRRHVEEVNRELPPAARIRRFLLLHKELHADDAELTRTRKVRRRHVTDRFRELVDALNGDGDSVRVEAEIAYQDGRTALVKHDLRIETTAVASAGASTSPSAGEP